MYILLDIGGTNTRVASSMDLATFREPTIFDTPQGYDEAIAKIAEVASQISGGIALRGAVAGYTRNYDKLPQWRGRHLQEDLSAALHTKVITENDTALVGLGEATHGAGKGAAICVYYTVSTGVNAVRIVNGAIDVSRDGFETGGQYLSVEPRLTLEELISGSAIQKRYSLHPKELGKDNPLWEELAKNLAFGIHNSLAHWSPDRVVIGGSMMNEIGISVERVAHHLEGIKHKYPTVPEIVHSSLGDAGGLWGAMALLSPARA
jgi:predicted NBD/HSP70 family sugar kinase